MYLLHMIIFTWWAVDLSQPAYYTIWNEILLFVSIWFITAIISMILWLFMEKPIANLTTLLLTCITGGDKQKRKNENIENDLIKYNKIHKKLISDDEDEEENGFHTNEITKYSLDGANAHNTSYVVYETDNQTTLKTNGNESISVIPPKQ